MGKLNVLRSLWYGKVGETVGAKWKNLATIRTYAKPANPNTEAQQEVRGVFKQMTSFVSLFAAQVNYLSSLDTRSMSVRNAIIKANKAQISAGTFDPATLVVNKGGLPNVTGFTVTAHAAGADWTATFTAPVATNLTDKAKLIAIVVDSENLIAGVGEALLSAGTVNVPVRATAGATCHVYYYVIDYRGSSRVGSNSAHVEQEA